MSLKTIGYAGVGALIGALALGATRKQTGVTAKNAKMLGGLVGAGLGFAGGQRVAQGKKLLPWSEEKPTP